MWPIFKAHFALELSDRKNVDPLDILVIGLDRKLNGYSIVQQTMCFGWVGVFRPSGFSFVKLEKICTLLKSNSNWSTHVYRIVWLDDRNAEVLSFPTVVSD